MLRDMPFAAFIEVEEGGDEALEDGGPSKGGESQGW